MNLDQLRDQYSRYFSTREYTKEAEEFESELEEKLYQLLEGKWRPGFDFETNTNYFDDERGVSVLIQNRMIDWKGVWNENIPKPEEIPLGALINFELFDNIDGDTWVSMDFILRRTITSEWQIEQKPEA